MTRRNGARPHWIRLNSRLTFGHGGFTLGPVTFIAADHCSAELRAHENRHVQWFYRTLGLMEVMYLVEFLIRIIGELLSGNFRSTITRAYHRISWERDAYRWGPLHSTEFDPLP